MLIVAAGVATWISSKRSFLCYEERSFEWCCNFSVFTMFHFLLAVSFIEWLKSMCDWKSSLHVWLDNGWDVVRLCLRRCKAMRLLIRNKCHKLKKWRIFFFRLSCLSGMPYWKLTFSGLFSLKNSKLTAYLYVNFEVIC